MLAKHLTPENCEELLKAASGKSKQAVETVLAGRFPQPDVAPMVRRLPTAGVPVPAGHVAAGPDLETVRHEEQPPTVAQSRPAPAVRHCPRIGT